MFFFLQTIYKMVHCVNPETNITHHISHICHIFKRYIWGMYAHIHAIYEITSTNHVTNWKHSIDTLQTTMHLTDISFNKYDYIIVNICHTTLILYRHIDETLVHICAKYNSL